jgi:hypothetical protein
MMLPNQVFLVCKEKLLVPRCDLEKLMLEVNSYSSKGSLVAV